MEVELNFLILLKTWNLAALLKSVLNDIYSFEIKETGVKLHSTFDFEKMAFQTYRIVSNKRPGGVAIFQKGDVYKRQVFNAKMQCLSLLTMTRRREI